VYDIFHWNLWTANWVRCVWSKGFTNFGTWCICQGGYKPGILGEFIAFDSLLFREKIVTNKIMLLDPVSGLQKIAPKTFASLGPHYYSLHPPTEGWPGWVDMGGWLHTEMVTHPSTNCARCWLTLLMGEATTLSGKPNSHRLLLCK